MSERRETIAKGDRLVCEAGHLIATARVEIEDYDGVKIENFDFAIDPVGNGAVCPTCTAPYLKMFGFTEPVIQGCDDAGTPTEAMLVRRHTLGAKLHVEGRGWVAIHRRYPVPRPESRFILTEVGQEGGR